MAFDDGPLALVGTILNGDSRAANGAVIVEAGRISCLLDDPRADDLPPRRLQAAYVAPGFVDLQVNGGFGHEVDDNPAALLALARSLPATGVTAFLPTLVSRAAGRYARCFAAFDVARAAPGSTRWPRGRWACTSRVRCYRRRAPARTTAPRSKAPPPPC